MHYSSLPQEWHDAPSEHCIPGLKMEVRVVRVDCGEERIGLNFVHAEFEENAGVKTAWLEAKAAKEARKAARAAAKAAKDAEKAAGGGEASEGAESSEAGEAGEALADGASPESPEASEPTN